MTLNPTILLHEGELENQDKVSVREQVKAAPTGRYGQWKVEQASGLINMHWNQL